MEERYGQLEIDAGNVRRAEPVQDQQEREKRTYQKNPYTYQIDEQLLRKEDEDEGDLVSPDRKIFESISTSNMFSEVLEGGWRKLLSRNFLQRTPRYSQLLTEQRPRWR